MARARSGKGGYDFVLNDKDVGKYHEKLTLWSYEFKGNGNVVKTKHEDALLRNEHDLFYVVPVPVMRNGKVKTEYRSVLKEDLGKVRAIGASYIVWTADNDYAKARKAMLEHLRDNLRKQMDSLERTKRRVNSLLREIDDEKRARTRYSGKEKANGNEQGDRR